MQTRSLIPQEIINQFISDNPIPDSLKLQFPSETVLGSEEILSLCRKTLEFVENNEIYNVYSLATPSFQHIFTELSKFYLSEQSSDIKFELLKMEKYMYLVTEMCGTQDISAYLRLIEEFCLDERFSELVHLLYWKHSGWYDGYSEAYGEWTSLLLPYLEYLSEMDFKPVKLLNSENTLNQNFVKEKCIFLKELFEEKGIQIEIDLTRLSDYSYLTEKAGEFKKLLSGNNNDDFYYELGLCSFIHHYANYAAKEDQTLIKLCLLSALYLSKTGDLKKSKIASEFNIFKFETTLIKTQNWENLLTSFCLALLRKKSTPIGQAEVLDCLLSIIRIKKIEDGTLNLCFNFNSILTLIKIDMLDLKSQTFDSSYMIYTFLCTIEPICAKLHAEYPDELMHFKKQLQVMLLEKMNSLNKLKPIVQDKYYCILRLIADIKPEFQADVRKNFSLTDTRLREAILSYEDEKNAILLHNLSHTVELLVYHSDSKDQASAGEFLSIVKTFIKTVSGEELELNKPFKARFLRAVKQLIQNFTQKPKEITNPEKLRMIGAYISGMMSWDYMPIAKIESEFAKVYFPLAMKNNEHNIWELYTIQEHWWDFLDRIPYDPEIMDEKLLSQYFKAYEDHIAVAQINCKTLPFIGSLKNFTQINDMIYSILNASIDKFIEISSSTFQHIEDMKTAGSAIDMHRINSLIKEARKFIYSTLNWIEYFIRALSEKKDQIPWTFVKKLLRKTMCLYFDPTFVFFIEPSERKLFQQVYSTIIQKGRAIEFPARIALCKVIQDALVTINNKILSDSNESARLISVIRMTNFGEHDSFNLQNQLLTNKDFSSKSISWLSFVIGFSRLKDVLQECILFTVNITEQEDELLESIKKVLPPLKELILELDGLFSPSNIEAKDLEEILSKKKDFLNIFSSGIEAFFKPLFSFVNTNHLLFSFASDILEKSLNREHLEWRGISFGIVTNFIECFNENIQKRVYIFFIQKGLIDSVLKEVSEYVHKEIQQKRPFSEYDLKYPVKLGYIWLFARQLQKNFEIEIDLLHAVNLRKEFAPTNSGLEFEQTFADWLIRLIKNIKNTFGFETILLGNPTVMKILDEFLKIFEKGYCHLNQIINDSNKALKNLKISLERMKNPPGQEGEIGFGSLFGGEGEDDFVLLAPVENNNNNGEPNPELEKEISDLEHRIEREEKVMSDKDAIFAKVTAELTEGLDSLIFCHTFVSIQKIDCNLLNKSKENAIGNLVSMINKFNKKVIDEVDSELFKPETVQLTSKSRQEINIVEYQRIDNKVYNILHTLQSYLGTLATKAPLLQKTTFMDESLIFGLYHSSMIIMNYIISLENKELWAHSKRVIADKFQNLVDNVIEFLKTYVSQAYFHKNIAQDTPISLAKWLKQLFQAHIHLQNTMDFNLLQPERTESIDFISLMQLAIYVEPAAMDSILLDNDCIFENLLCQEISQSWEKALIASLRSAFDAFLDSYLPYPLSLEIFIKNQLVSNKRKEDFLSLYSLKYLLYVRKFTEEESKALVETLFNKFNIMPKKNFESITSLPEQDIGVFFNMSIENKTPIYKIEEFLRQISSVARKIIDILMNCLIDNYLHNMVILSSTSARKTFDNKKFKETCGIIHILSNILVNHKDLVIYAVFNKNDYSAKVQKHLKKIDFLLEKDLDDFKSIAFLDCLFKLKYFTFNAQDGVVLTRALMSFTSVTFISPDDPETVLDVSYLIVNRILHCMNRELEVEQDNKSFSLIEGHIKLYEALLIHGSCWNHANDIYEKTMFDRYVRAGLLRLLRNIMCSLKNFVRDNYKSMPDYTEIDKMLVKRVSEDYRILTSKGSTTVAKIDKMKIENYKALLDDSELQEKLINHTLLNSIFDNIETDIKIGEKTEITRYSEVSDFSKTKRRAIINRQSLEMILTPVCVNDSTLTYVSENYKQRVEKLISMARSLTSYPRKLNNKEENMRIQNLESYWKALKIDLGIVREGLNVLPESMPIKFFKGDQITNQLSNEQESLRLKAYNALLYNQLKQQYPEETKQQNDKQSSPSAQIPEKTKQQTEIEAVNTEELSDTVPDLIPGLDFETQIKTAPQEIASQPEQVEVQIVPEKKKIKYFYHPTLKDYSDVDHIRTKVCLRLKILSEKVLISLYHAEVAGTSSVSIKKDITMREVTEELQLLPTFEQNMLLCFIEEFKDLQAFEYPENYKEIEDEYNMMNDYFSEYYDLLKAQRGEEEPPKQEDREPLKFEHIFYDGFVFSTDNPPALQNENQDEEASEKLQENVASLIKELYLIDDEVVESFISVFYLDYQGRMTGSDDSMSDLLKEMCRSPLFEVKLFDFFTFFLHCPEHIASLPKSSRSFPYTSIFNNDQVLSVYNVVALNILDFLSHVLSHNEYIFYQPRTFLEQHGLKSLRPLKAQYNYMERTSEMVSIADLIIGALAVPAISSEVALSDELTTLINSIFEEPKDFEPLEIKVGEELMEKPKVLSMKSCNAVLNKNFSKIIKSAPLIVLSSPKSIIKHILFSIESFYFTIEEVNAQLKKKIAETPDQVILNDIDPLILLTPELESFQELLEGVSSCICDWLVNKIYTNIQKSAKKTNDSLFKEALQQFSVKLIHEKMVEDFIIHILESLTYIVTSKLNEDYNGPLALCFAKICTHFYALACGEGISHQLEREQAVQSSEDIALPKLSKIVSTDPFPELSNIPELSKTFSYMRNERKFNFDMLYTSLWRKHQTLFEDEILYKDKDEKTIKNNIYVISKRLPFVLTFSAKQSILKNAITENLNQIGEYDNERELNIDRNDIIITTLNEFNSKTYKELRALISVRFQNEFGIDGGGPRKEWLTLLTKELFNPMNGLFKLSENGNSIQPNPASKIIPSHLNYFELAGIIIAKAIQTECAIDVTFTKSVLKHMLKREIVLADLEDIDLEYTKSLKWMLENPVDELEQSFTYETQFFDQYMIKDLLPSGSDALVTESNKKEFIKRVCEMRMKEEVQEELEAFLKGFHIVIPHTFLQLFSVSDLQLLIGGSTTVDLAEMKKKAICYYYNEGNDVIKWLWEVLESFNEKELSAFVFFISGSFRLPPNIFDNKPFRIRKASYGPPGLPIAHTCYLEIEIPQYTSKEELQQKLLLAIFEGQQGYMFG